MKNDKGLFIKDSDKQRIPRKLKKQIPSNTPYCYTYTTKGEYKCCPFYTWKAYRDMEPKPNWIDEEFLAEFGNIKVGWCKLVEYEITDQCKSCNLKIGY